MADGVLEPLIVGKWDGVHVWLQWSHVAPDAGYELEVAYLPPAAEWLPWIRVAGPDPFLECWLKIPTHKQGWRARARVRSAGSEDWEPARSAEFTRSVCRFEFESDRKVTFQAGDLFHFQVDGESCAYRLVTDLAIEAGEQKIEAMEAVQSSGFNQLDYPGHFSVMPEPGLKVSNVEASHGDLSWIGGADVEIATTAPDGPVTMALGTVNR